MNRETEPQVLVLSTLETKADETNFLVARLAVQGIDSKCIDLSLGSGGEFWGSERKLAAVAESAERAIRSIAEYHDLSRQVAIGLGGGTGSEIILRVFRSFPMDSPKLLVTPLPFDPRTALADNSVIIVPSLADICGLNAMLRSTLERTARLAAGLCRTTPLAKTDSTSIAVTSLGATGMVTDELRTELRAHGAEATVFHANGFGGAALVRMIEQKRPDALIDLTTHEMTRMRIDGPHVPMPERFRAAGEAGIPQIVLPGGINFLGFDAIETVSPEYLARPHYRHSGFFTHVKLTQAEMAQVATALCKELNAAPGECHLIVPMGGFSHQDRPGGAICDPALREVFLETAEGVLRSHSKITVTPAHIGDPEVAILIMERLLPVLSKLKEDQDAQAT